MSTQDIPLIEKEPSKEDLNRVPHPSHRHSAPCAPWPWIDLDDKVDPKQLNTAKPPIPESCDHSPERCNRCWTGYPQSRFPNWTERQVRKAKIYDAIHRYSTTTPCVCYRVDVNDRGFFTDPKEITAAYGDEDVTWDNLIHEQTTRYTIESLVHRKSVWTDASDAGHKVLIFYNPFFEYSSKDDELRYNIEPFFWSSSLNWITSRFQEEIKKKVGDHITITLTFLHSLSNHEAVQLATNLLTDDASTMLGSQSIDTQAPLILYSNQRLLVLDLLSVHLVRNINGSTIISFHPSSNIPSTTAKFLHERIRFAGQSVYWQSMFQKSPDPTFVLLTFIWHAMYAWDEALENLYNHICSLEHRVIATAEMPLTQELHIIRAHHLHYISLLDHYTKHVTFIKNTPNPAMDGVNEEDREKSAKLLRRECDNLLNEIERLNSELSTQERRVENVMALVFSSVNITDSGQMRDMTKIVVRDSAAMKQIAYLTMIFLPASFAASVFGMNVIEINPQNGTANTNLGQYVALALPLTLATIWIIIAFQSKHIFPQGQGTSFIKRLGWPFLIFTLMSRRRQAVASLPARPFQDELLVSEYDYGGSISSDQSDHGKFE